MKTRPSIDELRALLAKRIERIPPRFYFRSKRPIRRKRENEWAIAERADDAA